MKKILFVVLILLILLVGCTTQEPAPKTQQKTCSQLEGYACKTNEQCYGSLLSASDVEICCSVVCSEKSSDTEIKTCAEQNGAICKSGEKCNGIALKASDTTACCSTTCTKIEVAEEKKLEELFTAAYIPDYNLNQSQTGYERNALDYSSGDENHAKELLSAGWQENYQIKFDRYSDTENAFGQQIATGSFLVRISRYDKAKNPQNYLNNYVEENRKMYQAMDTAMDTVMDTNRSEFEKIAKEDGYTLQNVSLLSEKIGNNSAVLKVSMIDDSSGLGYKIYYITFYKNNYSVYLEIGGLTRKISDEKVIEYARKVEGRI